MYAARVRTLRTDTLRIGFNAVDRPKLKEVIEKQAVATPYIEQIDGTVARKESSNLIENQHATRTPPPVLLKEEMILLRIRWFHKPIGPRLGPLLASLLVLRRSNYCFDYV